MAKANQNKVETKIIEEKPTKKETKGTKEVAKKVSVKTPVNTKKEEAKKEEKTLAVSKEAPVATKEVKKAPAKKAVAKTTTAKTEVKAEVKKEEKKETPKKAEVKKEVAKKATKATTTKTVKAATTKTTATKAKATKKAEPKATPKKAVAKKAPAKKVAKKETTLDYSNRSLDECIHIMQLLGVGYRYENYASLLLDEENIDTLVNNIIDGNDLEKKIKEAKINDYDLGIVLATLLKVVDTMPVAALQFKDMKKEAAAALKFKLTDDDQMNAKHYLDTFSLAEKILVAAQRKNVTTTKEAKALLKIDVAKFFAYFFDLAYDILKTWQYEDVEYYQQFAFAIVSQFEDLYEANQNRLQMDCADLFIVQGDWGRGDFEYNYVLRENTIKDYIYYRFANIYVNIDLGKAKAIAYDSFQWVDDRYDYHANLVEITNK